MTDVRGRMSGGGSEPGMGRGAGGVGGRGEVPCFGVSVERFFGGSPARRVYWSDVRGRRDGGTEGLQELSEFLG